MPGRIMLALARLAYGGILPLMLLLIAINSHYEIRRENAVQTFREQMSDSLDPLVNLHDDRNFFHVLLQKNFLTADMASNPDYAVKKMVGAFKRAFKGEIYFFVWKNSGKLVTELTDEKQFRYVMKVAFTSFKHLTEHCKKVFPPAPARIRYLVQKMSILRGYFGQFLVEDIMENPLKKGYLGSTLSISEQPDKSYFWYQRGANYTVAAFIGEKYKSAFVGLKTLIKSFNHRTLPQKLGFVDLLNMEVFGADGSSQKGIEIKMEAQKFVSSSNSFVESRNEFLLFRQVSPRILVFCSMPKKGNLLSVEEHRNSWIISGGAKVFVLIFIAYCFLLRKRSVVLTVRGKMLLLFIFANILPLAILVSTGYEFFHYKRKTLINRAQLDGSIVLREFDIRYADAGNNISHKLNSFINKQNSIFGAKIWNDETIRAFEALIEKLEPSESALFKVGGKKIFCLGKNVDPLHSDLLNDFFEKVLNYFNHSEKNDMREGTSFAGFSSELTLLNGVLDCLQKITIQNFGSSKRWTYLSLVGDQKSFSNWGIAIVSWEFESFQRAFFDMELERANKFLFPGRIVAMEKTTEQIFPEEFNDQTDLRKILHRTMTRKNIYEDDIRVNGKRYVASALMGNKLSKASLVYLYPMELVENQIKTLKLYFFLVGFSGFAFIVLIVWFFSKSFFVPLSHIKNGIHEIAERNFRHRISYDSQDEFGDLIRALNETMEGMGELALAGAIQESLLPPANFTDGRATIFAKSEFMSRMGGDYFDYFKVSDEKLGIVFGDVAGHGVPAALIMAMMKAVVSICNEDQVVKKAADVLIKGNHLLKHLKENGWNRMMTCQCLLLDTETGEFSVSSAGHCFPIILRKAGQLEYIKAGGLPLGKNYRDFYTEIKGVLETGDLLFLYSDGFIEAKNPDGELFGFARFEHMIKACYSKDLSEYFERMVSVCSNWGGVLDDDVSLLILRFGDAK